MKQKEFTDLCLNLGDNNTAKDWQMMCLMFIACKATSDVISTIALQFMDDLSDKMTSGEVERLQLLMDDVLELTR